MSNYHLRDKRLTLKAKGLLSLMLSLPEDWDYTLTGLACINKESIDAIRSAVVELEKAGYIERSRTHQENGKFGGNNYVVHEEPLNISNEPSLENPTMVKPSLENPTMEKPTMEKPTLENPTQINKDIQNKDLQRIDTPTPSRKKMTESEREEKQAYTRHIAGNINLGKLLDDESLDSDRVQLIFEILLKTIFSKAKQVKINSETMDLDVVRDVYLTLGEKEIRYVCAVLDEPKVNPISNIDGYIKTLLFKAPKVADEYLKQKEKNKAYEKKKKPGFCDFEQRDYDFEELERKLLEKTKSRKNKSEPKFEQREMSEEEFKELEERVFNKPF